MQSTSCSILSAQENSPYIETKDGDSCQFTTRSNQSIQLVLGLPKVALEPFTKIILDTKNFDRKHWPVYWQNSCISDVCGQEFRWTKKDDLHVWMLSVDSEHTRFSDFTPSLHPPFCFSYERHVCIVVINGFSTVETCNAEDVMVNLKLPEGTWRRYQRVNRTI